MALQSEAVQQACRAIARQMRDYSRNLSLSFIAHRTGQHLESLSLAGQQLLSHPAGETALQLLRAPKKDENSALLGLAVWHETVLLGLARRQNMMAMTTLNIDEFSSLSEVRAQAWHMAWHAIDLYQQRNNPNFAEDFAAGVVLAGYDTELLAACNLRADVFAAAMGIMNGDKDAIRSLALTRSRQSLSRNAGLRPEYYPFAIAMEATETAMADLKQKPPSKKKQIQAAFELAESVGRAYDDASLKQWIYFCKPAQDMVWRGEDQHRILGAAIATSQDTFIRATGFLVSELTKIKPTALFDLQSGYSPFAEDRYNHRLHDAMIDRAFQNAVSAGMKNHNGVSFREAANEQNQKLTDGHIFGWCAAALQAAGKAFDTALAAGSKTPDEDARREFDGVSTRTTWDALKDLGQTIVDQYRTGYAVTFSDLLEFCSEKPAFAGVSSSIAFTLKDPGYLKKMNIANDVAPKRLPGFQPPAAAPQGPTGPAMGFGIPGFGLGSGGGGYQQKRPQADSRRDERREE